ncbi:hypothetical protein [Salinactinospora qingdaonensis]|uniref:Uncharacterized protein n=1 Tax=Salinactinospora qingdaonensis TaxID=702744 RepID=A0ABP7FE39_9ACTN
MATAQQFLDAPPACAFFLPAARSDISADHLCRPRVALDLAAKAADALYPWTGYLPQARREIVAEARAPAVSMLAAAVFDTEESDWWCAGTTSRPTVERQQPGRLPTAPTRGGSATRNAR